MYQISIMYQINAALLSIKKTFKTIKKSYRPQTFKKCWKHPFYPCFKPSNYITSIESSLLL